MQRLYRRYPTARFYLIMDDDVFIRHLLTQFIANRDPHELALYGPGYCDWGVKRELKEKISMTLNMQMPDFIHIVIGGIMLFTAAAVKRFTDSTLLMQCIDDLETLYGNQIFLWGGLKQSALYNQDWLFCWCLQVRMNGRVVFDKAFEDVEFPARKCTTLADSARYRVGIHHTNPRRIRALWRVYHRWAPAREANRSLKAWRDPAEPVRCAIDSNGDPRERHSWSEHRYLDTFKRPVSTRECKSIVQSKEVQRRFPHCISHMAYVRKHADVTMLGWDGPAEVRGVPARRKRLLQPAVLPLLRAAVQRSQHGLVPVARGIPEALLLLEWPCGAGRGEEDHRARPLSAGRAGVPSLNAGERPRRRRRRLWSRPHRSV